MSLYCWKGCILFVLLALYAVELHAVNISQCFANIVSCAENSTSPNCTSTVNISSVEALPLLRTSDGFVPDSINTATSISYTGCTQHCGNNTGTFSWNDFSQQYSVWLLPYLALLSQLPFGAQRRIDNLMSAVLTLGSPTLASYSLYLTLLNARWVNDRLFANIHYPGAAVRQSVVQALCGLQQVPLRVHPGKGGRLESLVVLPDNDEWWTTLTQELEYSHTWSIASATLILWVIIAYFLTVSNSISNIANDLNINGEGTGSEWLWLLPVVVGWLILCPKCDYGRVLDAYDKANKKAFVADTHNPAGAPTHVAFDFGLTITSNESRTPPIFNYARVWLWAQNVYITSLLYRAAYEKSNCRIGVDGAIPGSVRNDVPRECRVGNHEQIIQYCHSAYHTNPQAPSILWPPGIFYNIVVASLMALQLQWGTTCAALLMVWFTPTVGLGCRSVAYLIYGGLSTLVWILLVLSSILGYYAHHLLNSPTVSDVEATGMRPPPTPLYLNSLATLSFADNNPRLSNNVAIPSREIHAPGDDTVTDNPDLDKPPSITPSKQCSYVAATCSDDR
ncbi:hypothetical protein JVU11DRAFT_10352 [Chiua virens]|nr:hypothetical protein JVU11DRAFT_10352 [Chiua virens]